MPITIPPNTTLLRLVQNNSDRFYPQDWYYDEEFANTPLPEGIIPPWDNWPQDWPAAMWALLHLRMYGGGALSDKYIWTGDKDGKGNQVYVGGWNLGRKPGFQIHRHLTARPEMFVPYYKE